MVLTEAQKRASKKYYNKIKNENTEVYQNIIKKVKDYQKVRLEKLKQDPDKLKEVNKKKANAAKDKYYNDKQIILDRRKKIRDIRKDEELEKFVNRESFELSFE
tara:strand:+ start:267 stop:578 length:312 start_codon:yes stop_codon:yes gene_type:complete